MRVVARTRKPDGDMVRLSYRGEDLPGDVETPMPVMASDLQGADGEPGMTWWDRWWFLNALEQPGYQRLF